MRLSFPLASDQCTISDLDDRPSLLDELAGPNPDPKSAGAMAPTVIAVELARQRRDQKWLTGDRERSRSRTGLRIEVELDDSAP